MPPKMTTPVAIQKCERCFKKHAPPLGDQCLPLLLVDPESSQSGNQDDDPVDNSNAVEATDPDTETQGVVGGPLPDKDNSVVAAQLANLTSVVLNLASLFDVTRQEVSSLRAEVAAFKNVCLAPGHTSVASSSSSVQALIMSISAPPATEV
jgi:hypothetical protein